MIKINITTFIATLYIKYVDSEIRTKYIKQWKYNRSKTFFYKAKLYYYKSVLG